MADDTGRCEGRYPVPGRREEPFEVTYRCGLAVGHLGAHGSGSEPVMADDIGTAPVGLCKRCGHLPHSGVCGRVTSLGAICACGVLIEQQTPTPKGEAATTATRVNQPRGKAVHEAGDIRVLAGADPSGTPLAPDVTAPDRVVVDVRHGDRTFHAEVDPQGSTLVFQAIVRYLTGMLPFKAEVNDEEMRTEDQSRVDPRSAPSPSPESSPDGSIAVTGPRSSMPGLFVPANESERLLRETPPDVTAHAREVWQEACRAADACVPDGSPSAGQLGVLITTCDNAAIAIIEAALKAERAAVWAQAVGIAQGFETETSQIAAHQKDAKRYAVAAALRREAGHYSDVVAALASAGRVEEGQDG